MSGRKSKFFGLKNPAKPPKKTQPTPQPQNSTNESHSKHHDQPQTRYSTRANMDLDNTHPFSIQAQNELLSKKTSRFQTIRPPITSTLSQSSHNINNKSHMDNDTRMHDGGRITHGRPNRFLAKEPSKKHIDPGKNQKPRHNMNIEPHNTRPTDQSQGLPCLSMGNRSNTNDHDEKDEEPTHMNKRPRRAQQQLSPDQVADMTNNHKLVCLDTNTDASVHNDRKSHHLRSKSNQNTKSDQSPVLPNPSASSSHRRTNSKLNNHLHSVNHQNRTQEPVTPVSHNKGVQNHPIPIPSSAISHLPLPVSSTIYVGVPYSGAANRGDVSHNATSMPTFSTQPNFRLSIPSLNTFPTLAPDSAKDYNENQNPNHNLTNSHRNSQDTQKINVNHQDSNPTAPQTPTTSLFATPSTHTSSSVTHTSNGKENGKEKMNNGKNPNRKYTNLPLKPDITTATKLVSSASRRNKAIGPDAGGYHGQTTEQTPIQASAYEPISTQPAHSMLTPPPLFQEQLLHSASPIDAIKHSHLGGGNLQGQCENEKNNTISFPTNTPLVCTPFPPITVPTSSFGIITPDGNTNTTIAAAHGVTTKKFGLDLNTPPLANNNNNNDTFHQKSSTTYTTPSIAGDMALSGPSPPLNQSNSIIFSSQPNTSMQTDHNTCHPTLKQQDHLPIFRVITINGAEINPKAPNLNGVGASQNNYAHQSSQPNHNWHNQHSHHNNPNTIGVPVSNILKSTNANTLAPISEESSMGDKDSSDNKTLEKTKIKNSDQKDYNTNHMTVYNVDTDHIIHNTTTTIDENHVGHIVGSNIDTNYVTTGDSIINHVDSNHFTSSNIDWNRMEPSIPSKESLSSLPQEPSTQIIQCRYDPINDAMCYALCSTPIHGHPPTPIGIMPSFPPVHLLGGYNTFGNIFGNLSLPIYKYRPNPQTFSNISAPAFLAATTATQQVTTIPTTAELTPTVQPPDRAVPTHLLTSTTLTSETAPSTTGLNHLSIISEQSINQSTVSQYGPGYPQSDRPSSAIALQLKPSQQQQQDQPCRPVSSTLCGADLTSFGHLTSTDHPINNTLIEPNTTQGQPPPLPQFPDELLAIPPNTAVHDGATNTTVNGPGKRTFSQLTTFGHQTGHNTGDSNYYRDYSAAKQSQYQTFNTAPPHYRTAAVNQQGERTMLEYSTNGNNFGENTGYYGHNAYNPYNTLEMKDYDADHDNYGDNNDNVNRHNLNATTSTTGQSGHNNARRRYRKKNRHHTNHYRRDYNLQVEVGNDVVFSTEEVNGVIRKFFYDNEGRKIDEFGHLIKRKYVKRKYIMGYYYNDCRHRNDDTGNGDNDDDDDDDADDEDDFGSQYPMYDHDHHNYPPPRTNPSRAARSTSLTNPAQDYYHPDRYYDNGCYIDNDTGDDDDNSDTDAADDDVDDDNDGQGDKYRDINSSRVNSRSIHRTSSSNIPPTIPTDNKNNTIHTSKTSNNDTDTNTKQHLHSHDNGDDKQNCHMNDYPPQTIPVARPPKDKITYSLIDPSTRPPRKNNTSSNHHPIIFDPTALFPESEFQSHVLLLSSPPALQLIKLGIYLADSKRYFRLFVPPLHTQWIAIQQHKWQIQHKLPVQPSTQPPLPRTTSKLTSIPQPLTIDQQDEIKKGAVAKTKDKISPPKSTKRVEPPLPPRRSARNSTQVLDPIHTEGSDCAQDDSDDDDDARSKDPKSTTRQALKKKNNKPNKPKNDHNSDITTDLGPITSSDRPNHSHTPTPSRPPAQDHSSRHTNSSSTLNTNITAHTTTTTPVLSKKAAKKAAQLALLEETNLNPLAFGHTITGVHLYLNHIIPSSLEAWKQRPKRGGLTPNPWSQGQHHYLCTLCLCPVHEKYTHSAAHRMYFNDRYNHAYHKIHYDEFNKQRQQEIQQDKFQEKIPGTSTSSLLSSSSSSSYSSSALASTNSNGEALNSNNTRSQRPTKQDKYIASVRAVLNSIPAILPQKPLTRIEYHALVPELLIFESKGGRSTKKYKPNNNPVLYKPHYIHDVVDKDCIDGDLSADYQNLSEGFMTEMGNENEQNDGDNNEDANDPDSIGSDTSMNDIDNTPFIISTSQNKTSLRQKKNKKNCHDKLSGSSPPAASTASNYSTGPPLLKDTNLPLAILAPPLSTKPTKQNQSLQPNPLDFLFPPPPNPEQTVTINLHNGHFKIIASPSNTLPPLQPHIPPHTTFVEEFYCEKTKMYHVKCHICMITTNPTVKSQIHNHCTKSRSHTDCIERLSGYGRHINFQKAVEKILTNNFSLFPFVDGDNDDDYDIDSNNSTTFNNELVKSKANNNKNKDNSKGLVKSNNTLKNQDNQDPSANGGKPTPNKEDFLLTWYNNNQSEPIVIDKSTQVSTAGVAPDFCTVASSTSSPALYKTASNKGTK